MSRPEIIKKIKNKNLKLNNSQIEKIFNTFFQSIENALLENKSISLRGFGTFYTREIKEKFSARNPKTGESIYVPKKIKIRFKSSKKFNNLINK